MTTSYISKIRTSQTTSTREINKHLQKRALTSVQRDVILPCAIPYKDKDNIMCIVNYSDVQKTIHHNFIQ